MLEFGSLPLCKLTFTIAEMTDDGRTGGTGSPVQPRRRGRPRKGDALLVRLDARERQIAVELGGGVAAEGIRIALKAADRIGRQAARLLAQSVPDQGDDSAGGTGGR